MTICPPAGFRAVFANGVIEVLASRLDPAPELARLLAAWLCEAEQRRAERFRFERERRRFVVGRARLRQLLAQRLGVKPASIQLEYGPYGKPALASGHAHSGWRFNVSHCDELALYAMARGREVGVDVEATAALPEADAIARCAFSPREYEAYSALAPKDRTARFLGVWTRKEAFAKALGKGLGMPLDRIDISAPAAGWGVHSFSPQPGYVAAVASRTD